MSSTPLFINKPRMHSVPLPPLADERAHVEQERNVLQRERQERQEQREQQRAERRRAEARRPLPSAAPWISIGRDTLPLRLIQAAAKGRGEVVDLPPLTGLAKEIVRMGRVRRGEAVADAAVLPKNETARAVVFSAMRRRGEVLADADAQWLSGFLRKMEPRA